MGIRINADEQPTAPRQVLVLSTGPLASIKFGFWAMTGAVSALGLGLEVHHWLRLGWGLLRTWWWA